MWYTQGFGFDGHDSLWPLVKRCFLQAHPWRVNAKTTTLLWRFFHLKWTLSLRQGMVRLLIQSHFLLNLSQEPPQQPFDVSGPTVTIRLLSKSSHVGPAFWPAVPCAAATLAFAVRRPPGDFDGLSMFATGSALNMFEKAWKTEWEKQKTFKYIIKYILKPEHTSKYKGRTCSFTRIVWSENIVSSYIYIYTWLVMLDATWFRIIGFNHCMQWTSVLLIDTSKCQASQCSCGWVPRFTNLVLDGICPFALHNMKQSEIMIVHIEMLEKQTGGHVGAYCGFPERKFAFYTSITGGPASWSCFFLSTFCLSSRFSTLLNPIQMFFIYTVLGICSVWNSRNLLDRLFILEYCLSLFHDFCVSATPKK